MRPIISLLNLGILNVLDSIPCSEEGIPQIGLHHIPYIDYCALYSDLCEYDKTDSTCLTFYEYDNVFDGRNGLWNSLVYDDKRALNAFKNRFKDLRYIAGPDFTVAADLPEEWNRFACFKSAVINGWLRLNTHAEIIPNISYVGKESLAYCFAGIEKGSFLAYSTKGNLNSLEGKEFVKESLKAAIDAIEPIGIMIFATSFRLSKDDPLFAYAISKGVEILIPETRARERNRLLSKETNNGKI